MYKLGSTQKKILLGLKGGLALGMSSSPSQYFKTLRMLRQEWHKLNQYNFRRSWQNLSKQKLIEEYRLPDGSFKLILTNDGKKVAQHLDILGSSIKFKKPAHWDGKWRIVLFDIPEKDRLFRDILREHLKELEFRKLQHSVFISPHPYEKPILELVTLYSAREYVRVVIASKIDNSAKLKKCFFKN